MVSTVATNSVAHQVINRILLMIQQGILKPGTRLPSERNLASSLLVSRSTVRVATQVLEQNGIVEIKHGSGIYLKDMSAPVLDIVMHLPEALQTQEYKNFLELNESRLILEPVIGRLAALYITEEQLIRMKDIVSRMEEHVEQKSYGGYALEDMNFHYLCAEATQNTSLHRIAREYCLDLNFLFAFGKTPNLEQESLTQHKQIYLAIKNHDPVKAEQLLRDHVLYSLRKNYGYIHNQNYIPRKGLIE